MTALNRLQISYASDFDTRFVLGRQRLLIGNQRFIGNSGWRQHEQTFDALSFTNTSVDKLSLTYAIFIASTGLVDPALPAPHTTAGAATAQAITSRATATSWMAFMAASPASGWKAMGCFWICPRRGLRRRRRNKMPLQKLSTATFGARADYGFSATPDISVKLTADMQDRQTMPAKSLGVRPELLAGRGFRNYGPVTALVGYEALGGNGTIGFSRRWPRCICSMAGPICS